MSEPKFTEGPWQFVYGDLYDHSEDGHANGFTVLMAGARVAEMPDDEAPEAGPERIGRTLVIHQIRYAEDIFPEDAGRAEAEANARLIAAATELYVALLYVFEHIADKERGPRDLYPAFGLDAGRAVEMARAALAKAEGRS